MVDVGDECCPSCGREYLTASRGKTPLPCGHNACRQCAIRIGQGSEHCRECRKLPRTSPADHHIPPNPAVTTTGAGLQQAPRSTTTTTSRKSGVPAATVSEQRGGQGVTQRAASGVVTRHPDSAARRTLTRPKSHQGTLPTPAKYDTLPSPTRYGTSPTSTRYDALPSPTRYDTPPISRQHDTPSTHYNTLPTRTHHHIPIPSALAGGDHRHNEYQVPRPHSISKQNQKLATTHKAYTKDDVGVQQEAAEGHYNVVDLTRRYEHLSRLPQPSTLPHRKELQRSRENLSKMRRIRLSKSTSEVDSVDDGKKLPHLDGHQNPSNKKATQLHYGSSKNLNKIGNAREIPSPSTKRPSPGWGTLARPGFTKLKSDSPDLAQQTSQRTQTLPRTRDRSPMSPRGTMHHRTANEPNREAKRVPASPSPLLTTTQANHQTDGGREQEDRGLHVARPVYIVDSSDVLPHHLTNAHTTTHGREMVLPGYEDEVFVLKLRHELEELKLANLQLENELSTCRSELWREVQTRQRQEERQRAMEAEARATEQEAWRQREEAGRLREEVAQLRGTLRVLDSEKQEALRDQIDKQEAMKREVQQQEVEMRTLLLQEVEMLRARLSSERQRWEVERQHFQQEASSVRKQLSDAAKELSQLRAQQEAAPAMPFGKSNLQPTMFGCRLPVTEVVYLADSRGLPNLGNTCYINSVVQCLFTITPLRVYFSNDKHKSDLNVESEQGGEVAMAFGRVFNLMETGTRPYGTMKDFQAVVSSHDSVFQPGLQQDAHDLLASLLLWLHNDLATTSQQQGNSRRARGEKGAVSIISRLFHGQQESVITCPRTGRLLSATRETFNNLTLVVPDAERCSLERLLERHYRPQEVDWECRHCGQQHNCTYQPRLLALPDVLLIHFSRSEAAEGGRKTRVFYPLEGLTLETLLTHTTGYWPVYELVGVVNHTGTTSSGHYTAFCRSGSGKWWLWDDTELEEASVEQVEGHRDAHILFYHVSHDSSV